MNIRRTCHRLWLIGWVTFGHQRVNQLLIIRPSQIVIQRERGWENPLVLEPSQEATHIRLEWFEALKLVSWIWMHSMSWIAFIWICENDDWLNYSLSWRRSSDSLGTLFATVKWPSNRESPLGLIRHPIECMQTSVCRMRKAATSPICIFIGSVKRQISHRKSFISHRSLAMPIWHSQWKPLSGFHRLIGH